MKLHQLTADIFEQQMTRKEFLQHIAVALVLLLGGGYVLHMFSNFERKSVGRAESYSIGSYGGGTDSALGR